MRHRQHAYQPAFSNTAARCHAHAFYLSRTTGAYLTSITCISYIDGGRVKVILTTARRWRNVCLQAPRPCARQTCGRHSPSIQQDNHLPSPPPLSAIVLPYFGNAPTHTACICLPFLLPIAWHRLHKPAAQAATSAVAGLRSQCLAIIRLVVDGGTPRTPNAAGQLHTT